ncbi:large ribosomal subunit protein uL18c isoform X2 [Ziziphus jujuba]|uniref:Large ribosomal subunit protein uL18c isoform X2 n=1 Tax=Ziziphus jujuba TaxID=326968 RepID=A0ABM3I6K1_ZIZJJ|nr:large ribosomal subunit protein uL18c isoform X2 [Ziziphus jujuba]
MSAASLSFLHVAIAPSQRLRVAAPRLNPSPPQALVVEAKTRTRGENRDARHSRIRKKVEGTPERPRLCVFRSNKHLYVQEVAKKVGEAIAKSCLEKGITKVAYDRGGYPYHGRVKALADAAREHGLQF